MSKSKLRLRRFLALHASWVIAASPAIAHAQVPSPAAVAPSAPSAPPRKPTAAETARAKKLFLDGNALMKEGLWPQAIAAFSEANSLAPRQSIQNNLARAYREMKDMAKAYEAYELLLATYGDKMSATQKAETARAIEVLAVLTGLVTITLAEPDAAVTIDGTPAGKTPFAKPIRLNVGPHQLVVRKDGFEPLTQQLDLKGRDNIQVAGPLAKEVLTGHVNVAVQPADPTTKILVDGAPVGPAPWAGDLPPGAHTIVAKSDSMASDASIVNVEKKGSYDLNLTQIPQVGNLAVNVNIRGATISLDSNVVGQGAFDAPFHSGQHELDVTAPGYTPFHATILIVPGQRAVQSIQLLPAPIVKPPHDWKGVYSQLTFMALFGMGKPTNDVAQGTGFPQGAAISGNAAAGGGFNVRIGYSFGWFGVEGSILGSADYSSATACAPTIIGGCANTTAVSPSPTHQYGTYDFYKFGADVTVGARLMPKTLIVRPTLGVGFGAAIDGIAYNFAQGGGSGNTSTPTPFVAPVLLVDGGIEFGKTPDTRFYLGALLRAEFLSSQVVADNPNNNQVEIGVVNSTEIFFGPVLGMQFGE